MTAGLHIVLHHESKKISWRHELERLLHKSASWPGVMQPFPLQPVFFSDLNFHCNSSLFSTISYSDKRT